MIAVRLPDLKTATTLLFMQDAFDRFPLYEASFLTRCSFSIDGFRNAEFFPEEENREAQEEYILWQDLKPLAFSVIKGKRLPLRFKVVLRAPKDVVRQLLEQSDTAFAEEQVESLHMIFTYKAGQLVCTTGSSFKVFTMDRTLDKLWDAWTLRFFEEHGIRIEEM